jgi:hypothetical protein
VAATAVATMAVNIFTEPRADGIYGSIATPGSQLTAVAATSVISGVAHIMTTG